MTARLPVPDEAREAYRDRVLDCTDLDADVRAIATPLVLAALTDAVRHVERWINDEFDRDAEDKYTGHEAFEACSGYLLRQLSRIGGTEAATAALDTPEATP